MKTYVIHYKQVPERREHIEKTFGDLDLEFCDKYDKTMVPDWKDPGSVYKVFPEMKEWFSEEIIKTTTTGSCPCVAMSIIDILLKVKDEPVLILEDDAIPMLSNYNDRIQECLKNAPPEWDILFISDARCGSYLQNLIWGVHGTEWLGVMEMRNTCAWLVSPRGATKILELCKKHGGLGKACAFDFWFSRVMVHEKTVKCWWSICPFICNGNHIKAFDKTY